jgi:uncharacterized membrane protein
MGKARSVGPSYTRQLLRDNENAEVWRSLLGPVPVPKGASFAFDNFPRADTLPGMSPAPLTLAIVGAFAIGVVCGLRSLTAPATTAWASHQGWLTVAGTPFAFMGSTAAVAIFTLLALAELVADKLPSTPSRTAPPGLIGRILLGALSGAVLAGAGGVAFGLGAVLGAAGGVAGAFAGYQARTRLVKALSVPDFAIAVVEDVVAIGGGLFIAWRF